MTEMELVGLVMHQKEEIATLRAENDRLRSASSNLEKACYSLMGLYCCGNRNEFEIKDAIDMGIIATDTWGIVA